MPYYRVAIDGDCQRAMGLLAKAGIQNLAAPPHWIGVLNPNGVMARLSAETSTDALRRVVDALGDECSARRKIWREASGSESGGVEIPAWSAPRE